MISQSRITVRYAETDQMGIAHHSNYPIWYEVARTELIKKMGLSYTQMEQNGVIVPLVELQCKYLSAAYYEDKLIVEVSLKSVSPVKLEFEYCIYREGEEKPLNVGRTVHALVGKDIKPMNVRKMHPEIYQMLLTAMEQPLLEKKEESSELSESDH